jgi:ribosomal protein L15
MGKLNPEKFSQRLQDLNRYLDFIPIEKTSDSLKVTKAYGKSFPEDDIRSIMGCAIPPEWTVNLLSLGKEPWKFRDLEDQLNVYRQQWHADQQKQIIAQMDGKHPSKSNDGKRKNSDKNHHNYNGGRGSNRHGNTARGGRGGRGRGRGGRGGRGNNSEHLQNVENFNSGKKGHCSTYCSLPKKNNERSNMVSKEDFKNLFQTSMKEIFTKKDNKSKNNTEGDTDSLDMNVFEKLMEGKQPMFVIESNDDLISINDTNTCDNSMQNKNTNGSIRHNNYSNDYDELAYPFSKRIKLKYEPEKAQEKFPVQYTADIIVEIKNRDGTVVPMRSLLDTGTTATIILR